MDCKCLPRIQIGRCKKLAFQKSAGAHIKIHFAVCLEEYIQVCFQCADEALCAGAVNAVVLEAVALEQSFGLAVATVEHFALTSAVLSLANADKIADIF